MNFWERRKHFKHMIISGRVGLKFAELNLKTRIHVILLNKSVRDFKILNTDQVVDPPGVHFEGCEKFWPKSKSKVSTKNFVPYSKLPSRTSSFIPETIMKKLPLIKIISKKILVPLFSIWKILASIHIHVSVNFRQNLSWFFIFYFDKVSCQK